MKSLGTHPFERGLLDLGDGLYAWLQPDGGWGWSNAGLVVDGDQSLLVDTLFDVPLTAEMLAAMHDAEPQATRFVDRLINTHANGDHCNGNELLGDAEIISSAATLHELRHDITPADMARLLEAADEMGEVGTFFRHCFGAFDFAGVHPTLPNRTFEGELSLTVGDKAVELIQVGPAHTAGDVLVHVPSDKTVFTGDILFIDGTPVMWAGPIGNWIGACERILDLEVETVVPGHGPVTDRRGVEAVRAYLTYIEAEARERFDAGMSSEEAAKDIELQDFSSWGDSERIAVNVATLYREFAGGDGDAENALELFRRMAELARSD